MIELKQQMVSVVWVSEYLSSIRRPDHGDQESHCMINEALYLISGSSFISVCLEKCCYRRIILLLHILFKKLVKLNNDVNIKVGCIEY